MWWELAIHIHFTCLGLEAIILKHMLNLNMPHIEEPNNGNLDVKGWMLMERDKNNLDLMLNW